MPMAAVGAGGAVMAARLVVSYDVDGLTDAQVRSLVENALVTAEAFHDPTPGVAGMDASYPNVGVRVKLVDRDGRQLQGAMA